MSSDDEHSKLVSRQTRERQNQIRRKAVAKRARQRALERTSANQTVRNNRRRKQREAAAEQARRSWRPSKRDRTRRVVRERPRWTQRMVVSALVSTCQMLRSRAMGDIVKWGLDPDTIAVIEAMFGYPGAQGNGLASNMTTRMAVGRQWIIDAITMQRRHPDWSYYMVTVFDDRIRTTERETRIDLTRFEKRIRNLLAHAGIDDWLGVFEFQPYNNAQRGLGGDLSPHMHVLFWLPSPLSREARARLENSKRFESISGAPTVVVTERASTPGQIAHWAYYIFKGTDTAANAVPSTKNPGKKVQRDAFLRPIYAVRLLEIMSQMSLEQMIKAGGSGRAYRDKLLGVIRRRSKYQGGWPLRPEDTAPIWAAARSIAKKTNRAPVQFGPSLK